MAVLQHFLSLRPAAAAVGRVFWQSYAVRGFSVVASPISIRCSDGQPSSVPHGGWQIAFRSGRRLILALTLHQQPVLYRGRRAIEFQLLSLRRVVAKAYPFLDPAGDLSLYPADGMRWSAAPDGGSVSALEDCDQIAREAGAPFDLWLTQNARRCRSWCCYVVRHA